MIVELAMVALFLLVLLAGTFDLGMGWRDSLAVNEGARAGARVGSGMGVDVNADRQLLTSARSALESSGLAEDVVRVVIFRPNNESGAVPPICKTSTSSACNVFTGAQFRNVTSASSINSKGCLVDSASAWCPKDRIDTQISADYIGVWVQAEVTRTFGLLGKTQLIERTAVMRIEPAPS